MIEFLHGILVFWIFQKENADCRKKIKVLEGFDAYERNGRILFNDLAVDIAGVGSKMESTTPHQIDRVRISETMGAQES